MWTNEQGGTEVYSSLHGSEPTPHVDSAGSTAYSTGPFAEKGTGDINMDENSSAFVDAAGESACCSSAMPACSMPGLGMGEGSCMSCSHGCLGAMMPTDMSSWGAPGSCLGAGEYEADEAHIPPPVPSASDGPSVTVSALSMRQPFASLILHGVKELEARHRPALKHVVGPLAIHVSHKEEPMGSPLVSTAVAILRRRFTDDAISTLFQLPSSMANAHGCIVGLVDVENTWHADLFNEVEQVQLSEQAVYPAQGTFLTQLRSPRWLKYPVHAAGSNKPWQAQLPLDALPDGTEFDANGNIAAVALREVPAYAQQNMGAPLTEGDEMGLGLLGDDMVRQLQSGDAQGEAEKRRKKLQKALRQIDELKAKRSQGVALERTQEGKIEREDELRAELAALDAETTTAEA
uniref:Uncharacterized protein n=1 Tax=Chrysotila carterae TaxID=13221 RepID=A0A7S4C4P9_CHRCT